MGWLASMFYMLIFGLQTSQTGWFQKKARWPTTGGLGFDCSKALKNLIAKLDWLHYSYDPYFSKILTLIGMKFNLRWPNFSLLPTLFFDNFDRIVPWSSEHSNIVSWSLSWCCGGSLVTKQKPTNKCGHGRGDGMESWSFSLLAKDQL